MHRTPIHHFAFEISLDDPLRPFRFSKRTAYTYTYSSFINVFAYITSIHIRCVIALLLETGCSTRFYNSAVAHQHLDIRNGTIPMAFILLPATEAHLH